MSSQHTFQNCHQLGILNIIQHEGYIHNIQISGNTDEEAISLGEEPGI